MILKKPLYHCTHLDLKTGAEIKPGNWGQKLFEIGPDHKCWNREMALEAVRAWNFPDKPSRFKSTFACETIETIKMYKSKICPSGFIYEVVIIDKHFLIHKGDFNAVEPLSGMSDDIWVIANKYWQYTLKTNVKEWPGIECSEILTTSPLQVVGRVNP